MGKKRSIGVIVAGVTMLIYSIWLLIASGLIHPVTRFVFIILPIKCIVILFRGIPLVTGLVSVVYLFCGIGILSLKKWARLTSIYLAILLLIPSVYILIVLTISALKGELEGPAGISLLALFAVIPYLPFLIPLIFLTRPKVREQFN